MQKMCYGVYVIAYSIIINEEDEMDGFIERINRRHGHDPIRANAEAEAAEMKRLRHQAEQAQKTLAQYEACIQEMWKLNQRNVESATALHTAIDEAQKVLAALEGALDKDKEAEAEKVAESVALQALAERLAEMEKAVTNGFEEAIHKENIKVYRNVQAAMMEENNKLTEALGNQKPRAGGVNKAILFFVIISFLIGAGNLAILLLQLLEIL
jgi:DNA-directed RNA polymerase